MRLSFLHTIESNQAIFEGAARRAGVPAAQLRHAIRADLRVAMAHRPDLEAQSQVHQVLRELGTGADAVVVTCASLGKAADAITGLPVPIVRADRALAEAASRAGHEIVVLCALEATVELNRALFADAAAASGARVTLRLVPQAWELFQEQALDASLAACAAAAREAYAQGADVVAFAHPWMAPAGDRLEGGPRPLDAATAALQAALAARSPQAA